MNRILTVFSFFSDRFGIPEFECWLRSSLPILFTESSPHRCSGGFCLCLYAFSQNSHPRRSTRTTWPALSKRWRPTSPKRWMWSKLGWDLRERWDFLDIRWFLTYPWMYMWCVTQHQLDRWTYCGVGEFQCYDSRMLANLSAAATGLTYSKTTFSIYVVYSVFALNTYISSISGGSLRLGYGGSIGRGDIQFLSFQHELLDRQWKYRQLCFPVWAVFHWGLLSLDFCTVV